MTGPAPRIRWNETSPYTKAGQFGPFSFTIVRTATEPGWLLIAELPGLGRKQARSDALDELKAEAERWLVEFVSSLGAVFPDTRQMAADAIALSKEHADRADAAEARWSALKDHLTARAAAFDARALGSSATAAPPHDVVPDHRRREQGHAGEDVRA